MAFAVNPVTQHIPASPVERANLQAKCLDRADNDADNRNQWNTLKGMCEKTFGIPSIFFERGEMGFKLIGDTSIPGLMKRGISHLAKSISTEANFTAHSLKITLGL